MDLILPDKIIKGTLSVKKNREGQYEKCKIQLINLKGEEYYQVSLFTEKQVFHKNNKLNEINDVINQLFINYFLNMELYSNNKIYSYRVTSKGKLLTNIRKNTELLVSIDHNKKKQYLLPEGMIIPPLIDLGILTKDGHIIQASYDKYKQINRFIEIIDDNIKDEKKLKIIDFGCGKIYLTFIDYYYLTFIKKIECEIIGLDLKNDVIDFCNSLVEKYKYSNIKFLKGDIADFTDENNIDMIITLHACDTATDYALYHAIRMKCKYIFSVPCCQHEINQELSSDKFHIINKFGILKERFSAILTDSIRANILQYCGYKTQLLEFVDFENSPKNLLIRATLTNNKPNKEIKEEIDKVIEEYNISQTLYNLIFKNKN